MPATREHLGSVKREPDAWSHFKTQNGRAQEACSRYLAELFRAGEQRRQDQRCAVQGREWMKIIQLEALNERAIEHSGSRTAGRFAPTDDRFLTGSFKADHTLNRSL